MEQKTLSFFIIFYFIFSQISTQQCHIAFVSSLCISVSNRTKGKNSIKNKKRRMVYPSNRNLQRKLINMERHIPFLSDIYYIIKCYKDLYIMCSRVCTCISKSSSMARKQNGMNRGGREGELQG